MSLKTKVRRAGIVFMLMTTGMLVQGFPQNAAESDSSQEVVVAAHQDDVKRMQEILRDKGHYRGEIDGVFGLRTRASIRAYQKAANLPVTGQLDTRTAVKLGVRPERREEARDQTTNGKPSAYIKWAKGSKRTNKTRREPVKTFSAAERAQADREKTLQAQNGNRPQ